MIHPPAPLAWRPMQVGDVPAVLAIDRESFPTPARPGLFAYELTQNRLAHYQVLTAAAAVIGFSGFWMLADEAHVSTIAVATSWRGQGLGELLLVNLLYLAGAQAATLATLEVRHSNRSAQALYRKLGFDVVGERRRYYRDTGEDAVLMTVALSDRYYADTLRVIANRLAGRLKTAAQHLWA